MQHAQKLELPFAIGSVSPLIGACLQPVVQGAGPSSLGLHPKFSSPLSVVYVGGTNRLDDVARHDYLLSTLYSLVCYLASSSLNASGRPSSCVGPAIYRDLAVAETYLAYQQVLTRANILCFIHSRTLVISPKNLFMKLRMVLSSHISYFISHNSVLEQCLAYSFARICFVWLSFTAILICTQVCKLWVWLQDSYRCQTLSMYKKGYYAQAYLAQA